ncbi:tripartite tricarboxylate transporter substrate-binding protein [Pseudomonas matsuisoli]|uniref:MFS transporter n=1 Tax=Pseudomonas matsuisoli TaxID=1515666 RepID=A0A917Q2N8_9PSED|nr:tripartite tricarboxylate transporter substrate-binding protein [Pseudomonas matsuisoli]GGK09128.1 MFS transporter [Pseudomonas matsuisoli]
MINRRTFIGASSALLAAASFSSLLNGQTRYSGRLISGIAAGATGDRLAKESLGILSDQFNVDYRLNVIETRETRDASVAVKTARADGSTLLQTHSGPMVLFPATYRKLDYDPLDDFTPLALMGDYSFALSLGSAVPESITSLDSYLSWVDDNPDFRDVGFSLYGSQAHLASMILSRSKEVALRPQPYKSVRSLVNDMNSGTIAAGVTITGNIGLLADSRVRPIAVTGRQRIEAWPHVATFFEQGVQDMDIGGWFGWFAPARMPESTVRELGDRIASMQATAAYADLQRQLMLTQVALPPAQIRERMSSEMSDYRKLVKTYGISQMG